MEDGTLSPSSFDVCINLRQAAIFGVILYMVSNGRKVGDSCVGRYPPFVFVADGATNMMTEGLITSITIPDEARECER